MVKNLPTNAGDARDAADARDAGVVPGLGGSPGVGNGNPLQYSCFRSPTGRGAWRATVHGVTKSWTRLSTHTLPQSLSHRAFNKGFPGGSAGRESACNAGDLRSIPGLGRSSGEGKGYPLQHSGLENPMDHIVHGVAKSRT